MAFIIKNQIEEKDCSDPSVEKKDRIKICAPKKQNIHVVVDGDLERLINTKSGYMCDLFDIENNK